MKVFPLTDFPDRFFDMGKITLDHDGKQKVYTLAEVKRSPKHVLIRLEEIADMTEAEKLKGSLIKISRGELTPLPADSFYLFDIVGLQVFTPEGTCIGVVEDIIQTGANDVFVVNSGEKSPILVPALKKVVKEVDIQGGRMVIFDTEL